MPPYSLKQVPLEQYPVFEEIVYGTFLSHPFLEQTQGDQWPFFIDQFKKAYQCDHVFHCRQVHGNSVHLIEDKIVENQRLEGDGLITSRLNTALLAFHADCQVTFFIEPVKKIIGIAHAGFRGQVLGVYPAVLQSMVDNYQVNLNEIRVVMTPSLSKKHAEFIHYEKEFPKNLWSYKNSENYFDLKQMAVDQFVQLGIEPSHIVTNSMCTYSDSSRYYSFRRNRTTHRHVSFIAIKN